MYAEGTNPLARRIARARGGFTMVELLMVILIIGILVSLGLVGYSVAMRRGREAQIQSELTQLATALENFKGKYGAYPPAMRALTVLAGDVDDFNTSERAKFTRQLTRMFPRYTPTDTWDHAGDTADTPPADGARDFYDCWNQIRQVTRSTELGQSAGGPLVFNDDGLDIRLLDPAESLVFWLGGFPHRIDDNAGTSLTDPADITAKLLHLEMFAADPANPLSHESDNGGEQRIAPFFDFDETRLVDNDNDGWPEYVPPGKSLTGRPAPYVYFDKSAYRADDEGIAAYPAASSTGATRDIQFPSGAPHNRPSLKFPNSYVDHSGLGTEWGFCRPYARTGAVVGTEVEIEWINDDSFQIICAGLANGRFGPSTPTPFAMLPSPLVKFIPSGKVYDLSTTTEAAAPVMDESELDNLTNFTQGTVESSLKLQ
jgi:prepilin-type N-terminal cleavage/methylation domain-containing protein